MVNAVFTGGAVTPPEGLAAAERRVILSYVPVSKRQAVEALMALDDVMADIIRSTSEPMIGQMRLTWWHGALAALDEAPPPAQPVLQALAMHVLPAVTGGSLGQIVDGWEELLEPGVLDDDALGAFAVGRGQGLFAALAAVLGGQGAVPIAGAGRGWALADLAAHSTDAELAARSTAQAAPLLRQARAERWPRHLRALGAMVHLAARPTAGSGSRIGRILFHRLTGF